VIALSEIFPKITGFQSYTFPSIVSESVFPFSIRMNPVTTHAGSPVTVDNRGGELRSWVDSKFSSCGIQAEYRYDMEGYRVSKKQGEEKPIEVYSIRVKGVLKVIDAQVFEKFLCSGIGKRKYLGYGMFNIFS
jgi:hypothetical protein